MFNLIYKTVSNFFSPEKPVEARAIQVHPRQDELNALRDRALADQESWAKLAPLKLVLSRQITEKELLLSSHEERVAPYLELFATASKSECEIGRSQYRTVFGQLQQQIQHSTERELRTEKKHLGLKGFAQRFCGRPTWKERHLTRIRTERLGLLEALKDLSYAQQIIELRELELELHPILEIENGMTATAVALAALEREVGA